MALKCGLLDIVVYKIGSLFFSFFFFFRKGLEYWVVCNPLPLGISPMSCGVEH